MTAMASRFGATTWRRCGESPGGHDFLLLAKGSSLAVRPRLFSVDGGKFVKRRLRQARSVTYERAVELIGKLKLATIVG